MVHRRTDLTDQPYIGFMNDGSGDARGSGYMNRCYSAGIGLFYILN
jgi:hypothetical protein